jgi:Ca2+-binding EF-hand superfamily protein
MQETVFALKEDSPSESLPIINSILSENLSVKQVLSRFANKDLQAVSSNEKEFLLKQTYKFMKSLLSHQHQLQSSLLNSSPEPLPQNQESDLHPEVAKSIKIPSNSVEIQTEQDSDSSSLQLELSATKARLTEVQNNYDLLVQDLMSYKKYAEYHQVQKTRILELENKISSLSNQVIDLEPQLMMKVHKRMKNIDEEVRGKMMADLPTWQKAAIKIQSNWRRHQASKNYLKLIQKAQTSKEKMRKTSNFALFQKFSGLLKQKKLTLEECFRASDINGDKIVTCEEFSRFLSKLKLGVQAVELSRLIEILDEDLSGKLESQEFYEILAAYQVISDTSKVKGYSRQVLDKFLQLMKERGVTSEALFNSCGPDEKDTVNLEELRKVCSGFGLIKRELMVLVDLLDVDGNGVINRHEFMTKLREEESLFKVEIEKSTSTMPRNISSVISTIESSGMTLTKAFDLIHFPESGRVKISYISGSFAKLFPNVEKSDIDMLLSSIDSSKTGFIQYKDLIVFLHSYSGTSEFTDSQVKQHIISVLSRQNITINDLLQSKGYASILDISHFIQFSHESFDISEEQSISLFNNLSNFTGRVTLQDLQKFISHEKRENFDEPLSPRSHSMQVAEKITKMIASHNIKVLNIFKFADCKNTGRCSAKDFCSAMKKLIQSARDDELFELAKILPPSFSLSDLQVLLPEAREMDKDQFGMNEEQVFWVVTLKLAIEKMGVSPLTIFTDADWNRDKKISMDEFKSALKRCVPGSILTYTDICLIFRTFDKDSSGGIDQREFLSILENVEKSSFFQDAQGKIKEHQRQNDFLKGSLRPKQKTDEFPIPPLPLMHLSKYQDCHRIFENFSQKISSSTLTSEFLLIYKLRLSSLITWKHLQRVFNISDLEAENLFRFIDLHSKGVTYCFILCTVIDSYRMSFSNFPIPHNQSADPAVLKILEKMRMSLNEEPVFTSLMPLDKVLIWENFTSLPLEPHEVYSVKSAFPRICFNYHLAAALVNLSVGLNICTEEILHNSIRNFEFVAQASEFFQRFSLYCTDSMERGEFVDKISRILNVSVVEADTLFTKFNRNTGMCKMVTFFTFFDMVLSMYSHGEICYKLPILPFSTTKNLNLGKSNFFSKLSKYIDKPFIRYNLNLSDSYSPGELASAFEGFDSSQSERETYFQLLILNNNKKIKCYHLAAVLESYDSFNKTWVSSFDLSPLKQYFSSGRITGLGLLKSRGINLDSTLAFQDLKTLLPLTPSEYLNILFNFLDTFGRGYIFGHQLATVLDLSLKIHTFKDFPLCGNTDIPRDVRSLFTSNSRHLDIYNKSALSFYLSNKINPEDELDIQRFQVVFSYELTQPEAEKIFIAVDFRNIGKIRTYHYIACVESFCRNSSDRISIILDSPLNVMIQIALGIPSGVSTTEYFNDLQWFRLMRTDELEHYLANRFSCSMPVINSILNDLVQENRRDLFTFQFFALVDIYRNCVDQGKIARQPVFLPFKQKEKDLQTELILQNFANRLDYEEKGSCDYFWAKGLDPTEDISVQEFFVSFPDLNSQQCAQLFKDLNFRKTGIVNLYHFLAVLETYREKVCENRCRPVFAKKKTKVEKVLPLQDALNKLGRYFAGDNPKRRPLTSNEIFGIMDYNNDGSVSMNEFLDCLNMLPLQLTQNQIYLLLKEADLNGDGIINYKEFTNFILDFVKKPEIKEIQSVVIPKPEIREVKGLSSGKIFPPNSIEEAILNLKLYLENNKGSHFALEIVFGKIDYMSTGSMKPDEFSLALDRLKLPLSPNQKKELIQLADKNRNDLIPYKDFIDFLYNFTFEELPDNLPKGLSIFDYILKPSDFFDKYFKNSTILNSEKAALKRCFELLSGKSRFIDPDFGPEQKKNGSSCLYFTGKPPTSSYPKPANLEWPDLLQVLQGASFFKDHISSNDVIQGSLANCWFIGALSVLATRDELVRGSVQDLSESRQIDASSALGLFKGVYPPMFHFLSRFGLFVIRFFKEFSWRYVIIDSRVPMCRSAGELKFVFGQCSDSSELWVPLIEKAYAKLHGSYESLNNGLIDDALVDLTGLAADRILVFAQEPENLWKNLKMLMESGSLLGCSIESKESHTEVVVDGEASGLLSRHAYGIIDLFEINNPAAPKKRHRLLRIRNPWGQREWKGKWSSDDDKLKSNISLLKNFLKSRSQDEDFDPLNANDGTFLMSFKDWRSIFTTLFSCVDFPDHWSGLRMSGSWTESSSGGVPSSKSSKELKSWSKNPQFILTLEENSEVFISLSQKDARFSKEAFPFKKSLFYICFSVMKLEPNESKLSEFDEFRIVKLSKLRLHREVHLRTVLSSGRYCIVPATKKFGQFGDFSLSVYFSCNKSKVSLSLGSANALVIQEEEEFPEADSKTIKILRNTLEEVKKINLLNNN